MASSRCGPNGDGDRVRDEYEIALVKAFSAAGKPVFGICRGLQLINVAHGGTLYQDIRTQKPGALVHRDADAYDLNFHEVDILARPGSRTCCRLDGTRSTACTTRASRTSRPASRWRRCRRRRRDRGDPPHRPLDRRRAMASRVHRPELGVIDDTPLLRDFLQAARAPPAKHEHPGCPQPRRGDLITTLPADDAARLPRQGAARARRSLHGRRGRWRRRLCIEGFRAGVVRELEQLARVMTRKPASPSGCRATSSTGCCRASTSSWPRNRQGHRRRDGVR